MELKLFQVRIPDQTRNVFDEGHVEYQHNQGGKKMTVQDFANQVILAGLKELAPEAYQRFLEQLQEVN